MTSHGRTSLNDPILIVTTIHPDAALLTVEELDDVCEVHVVLQDDVPVDFHQRQGNEEDKVTGRDALGCPDGFPDGKHIVVHELWKTVGRSVSLVHATVLRRTMCICSSVAECQLMC